MNRIIDEGIKAEYLSNESSHDLVGMPIYCHFTSPMRRVSDCICHFLIKAYVSKSGYQWNTEELKKISHNKTFKFVYKISSKVNKIHESGEYTVAKAAPLDKFLNAIIDIIQLLPDDAKEIIIKNIK